MSPVAQWGTPPQKRSLSNKNPAKPAANTQKKLSFPTPSAGGRILHGMSPQFAARLYAHVLPVFWPYLWLQLRWIFKRQDAELRTLLIAVTKWGQIRILHTGDHWRAYRKPAAIKPAWDDPVWESHVSPNLACVFREESQTLLAGILPCEAGASRDKKSHCDFPEKDAKRTEGAAPNPDTS